MTSVLVLHNQPILPLDHPEALSEHSVVDVAQRVGEILQAAGMNHRLYGLGDNPADLWTELQEHRPDLVFNLYEGTLQEGDREVTVAGLLHWSGIPFTGSGMNALSLCRDKALTKQVLRGAGLPTAAFVVVEELPLPALDLPFPLIAKPGRQDASVGVDQNSVCVAADQLQQRVRYLLDTYGPPVLVEEYLAGRELHVAMMALPELRLLPPAEILFPPDQPGQWGILTYDAKWKPGSRDYETTPPRFALDLPPLLARRLEDCAAGAFRVTGCRDYVRVDFRVCGEQPYILEVNPNPEISDEAGFAGCLKTGGYRYEDFVLQLALQALSRRNQPAPTFAMPQFV